MKAPDKPMHSHLLDEARAAARAYRAVYRCGGRPTEALLEKLSEANAAIDRWNEVEETL